MPASETAHALDALLASRSDLWRGRMRPAGEILPSGHAGLDARLPGGGWPRGRLTEIVSALPGSGELALLLPALRDLVQPLVFIAPPWVPCPQALAAAGLDLSRLLVLRRPDHALWAAEQCLKSGLCGAVVAWHPPGRVCARSIRRLQLAAESGRAPLFLAYRPGQQPPPGLAALRMRLQPGAAPEIVRARNASGTRPRRAPPQPPARLVSRKVRTLRATTARPLPKRACGG